LVHISNTAAAYYSFHRHVGSTCQFESGKYKKNEDKPRLLPRPPLDHSLSPSPRARHHARLTPPPDLPPPPPPPLHSTWLCHHRILVLVTHPGEPLRLRAPAGLPLLPFRVRLPDLAVPAGIRPGARASPRRVLRRGALA
jgi:hypothetical protein